jgi:hypothetical protein
MGSQKAKEPGKECGKAEGKVPNVQLATRKLARQPAEAGKV